LAADVNAIAVGYAGKTSMLKAVFGSSETEPENLPEAGAGMFRT
jgi:hypothetical protein